MAYPLDEKTRDENFRVAVLSLMGIVSMAMVLTAIAQPNLMPRPAINLLVIDGLGIALLLARRISVTTRTAILLAGILALIAVQAIDTGGIRSPGANAFLYVPLFAAVLLGSRGTLYASAACLVVAIGLVVAEKTGHIGPPQVVFALGGYVGVIGMFAALALSLLLMATSTLHKALIRAKLALEELGAAQAARERAERQLFQSQKMESLGTLAGGIAHDFTNLLIVLRGNLEEGRHAMPSNGELRKTFEESLEVTQRAQELTQRLLLFARGEQGPRHLLSLQSVAEDTLRLLHGQVPKSIRLETRFEDTASQVEGDGTQLQQVMLNLCLNALQAMEGQDGVLRVSVDEVERSGVMVLRLSVGDTGPGMPAAVKNRIFEPFFSTKRNKGSGLGLAVVHGIVQGHGGDIVVDSTLGHGSTFHVHLPVAKQSA